MRVLSIEIFGFKSFAERVVIAFREGLNAVVGPNGCGKSNVADACKWVLGEKSASQLRSSKMQDVIFHGSTKRKPVNLAEVTLTFANHDRILPTDYSEVAITRRIHRDGESLYFINKQPARLRDVHELIRPSALTIIAQGQIDRVISQTPLERRALLEEAAGISCFLEQRADAAKRLALAEEARARACSLVEELERQRTTLQEQAVQAQQYTSAREELTSSELALIRHRYQSLGAKRTRHQERLAALPPPGTEDHTALEEARDALAEAKQTHDALVATSHTLRSQRQLLEQERAHTASELQRIEREQQANGAALQRQRDELAASAQRHTTAQQQLESQRAALATLEQERTGLQASIAPLQASLDAQRAQHHATQATALRLHKELQSAQATVSSTQGRCQMLSSTLAKQTTRLNDLQPITPIEPPDSAPLHALQENLANTTAQHAQARQQLVEHQTRHRLLKPLPSLDTAGLCATCPTLLSYQAQADEHAAVARELEALQPQVEALLAKQRTLDSELKAMTVAHRQQQEQAQQQRYRAESIARQRADLEREIATLTTQHETAQMGLQQQQQAAVGAQEQLTAFEAEAQGSDVRYQEQVQQLAILTHSQRALEATQARASKECSSLEALLQAHTVRAEEGQKLLQHIGQQIEANRTAREELQQRLSGLAEQIAAAAAAAAQHEEGVQGARVEVDAYVAAVRAAEMELADHQQQARDRAQRQQEEELALATLDAQETALDQELQTYYTMARDELFQRDLPALKATELERRIAGLKEQLQLAGAVNLRAVEEFDVCTQRAQEMQEQLIDIERTQQELHQQIIALEHEARERFRKAYDVVRAAFLANFQTLFGGGVADLQLVDHEDPLLAGIEVVAKPPGKEGKSLELLSGGEKCLTALALLFGIFEVRPALFCILDEVDAPLDEINVGRFGAIVESYASKCQFLLVTHNKKTMVLADTLIGVSMQERGVSQVLRLEMESIGATAEAGAAVGAGS